MKFGIVAHSGGGPDVLDSSPGNSRAAVEGSLKQLGTDHIDLYSQQRVDPQTPIEDPIFALAKLVAAGMESGSLPRQRSPLATFCATC